MQSPPSLTITLSWPSADLSQNARVHPLVKARAVKRAKTEAYWMAKSLMSALRIAPGSWSGPFEVRFVFHARQGRDRDDDNFIGRMKSARDGIAEALGVNDASFITMPVVWGARRNGTVEVTITPAAGPLHVRGRVS